MDYNLGRGRGPRPARFEDLDEETRNKITRTLVEVISEYQSIIDALKPPLEVLTSSFSAIADIASVFARLADEMRWFVPNWPENLDVERAWRVADEGIPVAFVPRPEIVVELVDAEITCRQADTARQLTSCHRLGLSHRPSTCLGRTVASARVIAMMLPLLQEAIDTLEAGHAAAACALSVVIIDSLLRRTEGDLQYQTLRKRSRKNALDAATALNQLRVELAWRPMHSLLEEWNPRSGSPPPTMPSRHVVIHWPDPRHLSNQNAIVTVMVATSLFLGLCESERRKELIEKSS
ncbi:Uncharacterised protein [Mycobacteroides abscessus subsp. massiliense]|uniref:hypothetical protein n=1 Tax=Mycobacteroides abscessus TaxID=36809 RepID=UPI0009CDC6EF|nr:hypothetical protein [Mycobacteroides abscessus]SKD40384.1 Uncharacterised protein [Mycobacteroides abscessus subsp. massiliense]SKD91060.1 Uncharacterised protein [Mycobacteroides abscessus subsp. massiliense]SKE02396.1 Uncharacterised protein [Mycobacteroides abscessus subsp. massiliense]SKE06676.1 Uncharacterised protein [Mycobacteroides abscessus subsp. massiliense]SKE22076.1 Uncharacterised protein [Mycobacteroides abscessus subsp. massiliense]